jgi:hypothetical protein
MMGERLAVFGDGVDAKNNSGKSFDQCGAARSAGQIRSHVFPQRETMNQPEYGFGSALNSS